jgi:amino acid adenylation domain-containing protein
MARVAGCVEVTPDGASWTRAHHPLDQPLAERLRGALDLGSGGQRACEAAFALVLSRHLGADSVVFGVQCHAADGSMIPPFVQRASCEDAMTIAQLTERLQRAAESAPPVTDGFATMDLPVLTVEPHRDAGAWPDTSAPSTPRHAPAVAWLQVTVSLVGVPQLLAVYDTARLMPERARILLASFQHTLSEVLREPGRQLGQVHVLPPGEEELMLVGWNQTKRPFPDHLRLHELFEGQVDSQPDAPALEADGASLTYRELDERANQIAHALRARGVMGGDYVGVCLERGANLVAALLGVVKAGGIYIPLDPSYPTDRLRQMVTIAEARLVLTETPLRHLFQQSDGSPGRELLALDTVWSPFFALRPHRRLTSEGEQARQPTDPCYVIFTSGSTGEPKGVVVSHRAVINTLDWVSRTCAVGPGDRCLFVTSASFDLSVYDLFGALGAGATVVVASSAVLADPEVLADVLVTRRITIWNSTPASLERLLPALTSQSRRRGVRTHLRKVLLSGDWIPVTLPKAIRAIFPRAEVLALGGATEAAIWSNAYPVRDVDPAWKSIPYGRPIQNARYHILDRRMHPTPVGVAGDLYIGGVCLADGYLNRPELTAERFIPDPFQSGERLYRTGDLARYFDDGTIEFLGRADHQVKVRGYRVELGEVESALLKQPGIRAAACIARADAFGQKVIVGFIVPQREHVVNAAEVLAAVGRLLPSYMIPSRLIVCEALPLSANGKVDRSSLSALEKQPEIEAGADATEKAAEPATAMERTLQLLWQELLGRPHVGIHDDFNALGGHSLLAVKMIAALRERLGIRVPLAAIARYTTVARLAAHLPHAGAGTLSSPSAQASDAAGEGRRGEAMVDPSACPARAEGGSAAAVEPPHLLELNSVRPGSRPPLVLVAGVGGYAFTYRNFPRLFGLEQPVYCFQSVGAEPTEPLRPLTIEEIAQIYEKELEQALPEGQPVILGGFSFGVLPAFELARRLERRGWPVPLLISFDGFAPGYPRLLPLPVRAVQHGRALLTSEPEDRRAYLAATGASMRARVMRVLGREAELSPDLPFDEERNARAKQLAVYHRQARDSYRPSSAVGSRLLLLRTEQPEHWLGSDMDDPLYDWEQFVRGPISMTTLPGVHTMLLDSHANQVAATDVIAKHVAEVASELATGELAEGNA